MRLPKNPKNLDLIIIKALTKNVVMGTALAYDMGNELINAASGESSVLS